MRHYHLNVVLKKRNNLKKKKKVTIDPLSVWAERGLLYIFAIPKYMIMENFVALVVMVASLSVAGLLIMKNFRTKSLAGKKSRIVSILLLLNSCLLLCDMAAGKGVAFRLPLDLLLSLFALYPVMSSVLREKASVLFVGMASAAEAGLAVYYVLCSVSVLGLPPEEVTMCLAALVAAFIAGIFIYGVSRRLADVRSVMASGNAWSYMCLIVETVYLFCILVCTLLMLCLFRMDGDASVALCIVSLLFCLVQLALGLRCCYDAEFLIFKKQEERIAMAYKASKMELAVMRPKPDEAYQDVYSRIVSYFEEEKPYLNGDLTINDVVKVVYTNKLYISRAISHYAGKNFCQFVNWHRVMYSVERYRANPEMTVTDLWQACGFNSVVPYNMAFKLFMGENPGEWCRKEKARLVRMKK